MKLKDFKYGMLVESKIEAMHFKLGTIGMLIGVTNNVLHARLEEQANPIYCIFKVEWQNGLVIGIHPDNVRPFEGY